MTFLLLELLRKDGTIGSPGRSQRQFGGCFLSPKVIADKWERWLASDLSLLHLWRRWQATISLFLHDIWSLFFIFSPMKAQRHVQHLLTQWVDLVGRGGKPLESRVCNSHEQHFIPVQCTVFPDTDIFKHCITFTENCSWGTGQFHCELYSHFLPK